MVKEKETENSDISSKKSKHPDKKATSKAAFNEGDQIMEMEVHNDDFESDGSSDKAEDEDDEPMESEEELQSQPTNQDSTQDDSEAEMGQFEENKRELSEKESVADKTEGESKNELDPPPRIRTPWGPTHLWQSLVHS